MELRMELIGIRLLIDLRCLLGCWLVWVSRFADNVDGRVPGAALFGGAFLPVFRALFVSIHSLGHGWA